ncbi:MAG: YbaB/EbfC family nucleoid-associated protein [Chloroflexi bacterium]|nr:YbaB/EbfC family nucleoid-associated protein [Chloroflexota bacterium]
MFGNMKMLQQMQQKLMKAQEALANETVEVSAGGGAVKMVMTGQQRVLGVEIDPQVVDPEDVEMLQDLIMTAVNDAIAKSQEMAAKRLSAVTGGLKIPGLM